MKYSEAVKTDLPTKRLLLQRFCSVLLSQIVSRTDFILVFTAVSYLISDKSHTIHPVSEEYRILCRHL